jgi:hypothetical protein
VNMALKLSVLQKRKIVWIGRMAVFSRTLRQWRTQEFFSGGGGGSKNSVEDRGPTEWGSGGGSPQVRGFGGSCNLVQEN